MCALPVRGLSPATLCRVTYLIAWKVQALAGQLVSDCTWWKGGWVGGSWGGCVEHFWAEPQLPGVEGPPLTLGCYSDVQWQILLRHSLQPALMHLQQASAEFRFYSPAHQKSYAMT